MKDCRRFCRCVTAWEEHNRNPEYLDCKYGNDCFYRRQLPNSDSPYLYSASQLQRIQNLVIDDYYQEPADADSDSEGELKFDDPDRDLREPNIEGFEHRTPGYANDLGSAAFAPISDLQISESAGASSSSQARRKPATNVERRPVLDAFSLCTIMSSLRLLTARKRRRSG
jgi:hypothetical protein